MSGFRGEPIPFRKGKEVSLTDPQAAWVARKGTDPFFAYDANYLIDNKAGIIVDAEGTGTNRAAEIAITETMVERIKCRFEARPAVEAFTPSRGNFEANRDLHS
jgi:hypothetical protein